MGHCHCDANWAPPFCETPGAGGSLDSGPASDPNTGSGLSTVLYVMFFFILPVILVILCVTYYIKGGTLQSLTKKTKPDTGFITVERRRSKSRPPSRLALDSKDISGPVSVEGGVSLTSSPTHALLPRSTTETSQISVPAGSAPAGPSEAKQGGRFSVGMLTGLGGFPRRKSGDCSVGRSPPDSLTSADTGDTVHVQRSMSYKCRTKNLLKSINKSISFPAIPSPKFRGVDNNKYEVRIEPRQVEELQSPAEENLGVDGPQAATSPTKSPTKSPPVPTSISFSSLKGGRAATLPTTLAVSPTPVEKVETRVVLESSTSPVLPQYDPMNNPKLAFGSFPQSSSFSAAQVTSTEASLAASLSSGSISAAKAKLAPTRTADNPGWKRPPNPSSYINRNATAPAASSTLKSSGKPLQSPFLKASSEEPEKSVSTVTVSPFSQMDSQPKKSASKPPYSSPWSARPPPPPPASAKPTISAPKLLSNASEPTKSPTTAPETVKPQAPEKPSSPITSKPTPPKKSSTLPSPSVSEKAPTIAPFKGKDEKSSAPTATVRPLISKPVLQTATPNAASLIAKAPSTGVSQSSILATNIEKEADPFKPPRDKTRRAVFSDQIILPSPTNPNNPPIIHQPHPNTEESVGKVITPTWSTQPQAQVQEVQICHIQEKPKDTTDTSTFSKLISNVKRTPSVSEKSKTDNTDSLPKRGRPDRSSLRALDISSPVLQSGSIQHGELLPVCRSPDSATSTSSPHTSTAPSQLVKEATPSPRGSPCMKRPAPPPPSAPKPPVSPEKAKPRTFLPWRAKAAKDPEADRPLPPKLSSSDDIKGYKRPDSKDSSQKRRPASIATSKPVRPNAPPPKPPPSRDNSKETSPEEIYIYDDASAVRGKQAPLASASEVKEPIYDTIKEVPDGEDDDDFETPVGSPVTPKKVQDFDTRSTTSSGGEEDLMGSILKEVAVKSEGESIYSSLMRKDKKRRKKPPPVQD